MELAKIDVFLCD